jgi:hypothetical protein
MLKYANEAGARGAGWALLVAALSVGCSASTTAGGANGSTSSSSSSGGANGTGSSSGSSGEADASGAAACADDAGVSTSGATVWTDGTSQATTVTIAAGSTTIIAPGATISMAAAAGLVVRGTLVASSVCGAHANLAWPSGATAGITVAQGGLLRLDGVDISGAASALNLLGGATAEYDHGTITGATTPFFVGAAATLNTNGATVTGTRGASSIVGSLVATNLDYDSNGNSGIFANDASTLDIRNSKLHGSGPVTDMVISGGSVGGTIHVQNTEIYQVHCAFHFEPVKTFDISYTNMHDNAFGFMLYGSATAGGTMTYSNVDATNAVPFSTALNNGPITFDHCYIPAGLAAAPVTITNPASSPVAGTGQM